jgi:hypothetical protein
MLNSAGTVPWRHAEVFRLEGEGELQAFLLEIIAQHVMHAAGGEHVRQRLEQVRPRKEVSL